MIEVSEIIGLGSAMVIGGASFLMTSYLHVAADELLGWLPMIGAAVLGGLFVSATTLDTLFSFLDCS